MTPSRTLPDALNDAAKTGEGFVFVDGATERRVWYAEIAERSRSVARSLLTMGLTRADLVAVIVADAEQFLTALFGASMAGVVPASLYPPATTTEPRQYLRATAGILQSARVAAVISSPSLVPLLEELRSGHPGLADLKVCATSDLGLADLKGCATPDPEVRATNTSGKTAAADISFALPDVSLDDIAFVQFTSGSTSDPKGVVVTHRGLSANIEAINGEAGLATSGSDSAVSWLPLYHDMGLVGMALGAMYAGRPAVLMTPATFVKRPAAWLRAIARHRATISFAPNFAYDLCVRRVKDHEIEGLDLTCWRVAGCGGEPIHAPTLAAFAERFAAAGFRATSFLPSYGLAEHVLAATFPPRGRGVRVERLSDSVDIVSCGSPLPGHQVRIVDAGSPGDERARCRRDHAEGAVRDEGLLGRRRSDRADDSRRLAPTGDLGFIDRDELFVCGRLKDMLVVNSRKYHPQDLEWAIDDLAGIRRGRVVAFGIPRPGAADRVVMIVEAERRDLADSARFGRPTACPRRLRPSCRGGRARADWHHRPHDERQSAAAGCQAAISARRARAA